MRHTRKSTLKLLRDAVAEQKKQGWPKGTWRQPLCKLAAKGTDRTAGGLNAVISCLNAVEWDSLGLPASAADDRPDSAKHDATASSLVVATAPNEVHAVLQRRRDERKAAWMPVLAVAAEELHREGVRVTVNRLAIETHEALQVSQQTVSDFVSRFCCAKTEDRITLKMLNADGSEIERSVRKASLKQVPAADLSGDKKNGSGLSERDKQLLADVDQRYESALAALEPRKRTRKNLAVALGFGEGKVDFVDAYLFQHREFAAKLADGNEALSTGYLKKTG